MALSEDLLKPIDGPNPSGENIRFNTRYPVYDKIKEARREDEELPEGVWQHERKLADFPLVIKLAEEALSTKTKDLQLAAWLTEAWLKTQGFNGLWDGLKLNYGLVQTFWDTLYPEIEDGDAEMRATPLEWIGGTLGFLVRSVPLTKDGYGWTKYQESRTVGFEDQAKSDNEKKARQKLLAAGKLAPEDFQKSFVETPKTFYLLTEKNLDGCLGELGRLDQLCQEKFGEAAPGFGKLKTALEEVRHVAHGLLEKKRETEPDPVEEDPIAAGTGGGDGVTSSGEGSGHAAGAIVISIDSSSEPADRRAAISSIASAAAFLRKREPQNPASYLMLRGLRWGELRAAGRLTDPTLLEAPPGELRRHIKKLALDRKWNEMLEAAESAMALPCSRAWLDLQRFVVEACTALGADYEPVAAAIRSELHALLDDLPELLDANLLDDTPAANAETQAWLHTLREPPAPPSEGATESANQVNGREAGNRGWPRRSVDSYSLAKEALKAGQVEKAFQIMRKEIQAQDSGRGRFFRKAELVDLCLAAGKETIAQPLLDDIAAAIEAHKLEDWESREVVAATLATIMTASARVKGNAAEKQKLFERICRLDPVRALTSG
ncbi:MAG TPA: type VI secretion system protein TssA [Terriglobia bacterium]|nr:type VI secretion system protein TssA [Terriglobia bacterium]